MIADLRRAEARARRGLETAALLVSLAAAAPFAAGCGKKGPPLPPLVLLPAAPADLAAERRGEQVDLRFTVPAANTNNTRPANMERVDVYAVTSRTALTDDQLVKHATKVGSVPVKTPPDPDAAATPEEAAEEEPEPPEGAGLDQGAVARVQETLTPAAAIPIEPPKDPNAPKTLPPDDEARPLVGAPPAPLTRTYAVVGINAKGRRGPVSKRVSIALMPPPPAPSAPTVAYTENAITVTWAPPPAGAVLQQPASGDVLPAKPIGVAVPAFAFNVYSVGGTPVAPVTPSPAPAPATAPPAVAPAGEARLTKAPITGTSYVDNRIEWGAERCYTVRVVETMAALSVESSAPPAACVKLVDTFPPAAPQGLTAVASEGAINLIWQPNGEPDLVGYIVLRDAAPGDTLVPLMTAPIQETTFRDNVQAGIRHVYVVQAVDKAGNVSKMSNRVEETAR